MTMWLAQGKDFKVKDIKEDATSMTATATIDTSDSKYYTGTATVTYDLYPKAVSDVKLTLDREVVYVNDDYVINTDYDVFGYSYLSNFVEDNIQIAKAEIIFADKTSVTLTGDEIAETFKIGYYNADKSSGEARVMVMFKDGKKYPTGEFYMSDKYTIKVK